jgi:peptide/nickel transport system ATP-binding protein
MSEPFTQTPDAPKTPLLSIRNLGAAYLRGARPPIRALNAVSLELSRNEVVGVAGESGCGKSTLLKVLSGSGGPSLRVDQGNVTYQGRSGSLDATERGAMNSLRWKAVSYVPQSSMSVLNPVVRIGKQFRWVVSAHATLSRAEADARIRDFITGLGLPERVLVSFPHQLSGGMRQRVVIAMATFLHPELVLADEPTTGLDVVVQRTVLEMIRGLQRDFRMTVLMVSHDMGIHYQVSDRVMVMYAGDVVEVASTNDLFSEPLHPYTQRLIASLPRLGDQGKREGISGAPPNLAAPPAGCRFHPRCPVAMDRCRAVAPVLQEAKPGHFVACHLHDGATGAR